MSRASFERLMTRKPRALELIGRGEGNPPLGRKAVGEAEMRRRMDPIVAGVASGHVPLDEISGQAVADALEAQYKKVGK